MTAVTADVYVPGRGFLYRLDPRVKMWLAVLLITLSLVTPLLWVLLGAFVLVHALLVTGGLPARTIRGAWRALLPLVAIILVLQPLVTPASGEVIFRVWTIEITAGGILTGVRYGVRMATAALAVLMPVLTTPVNLQIRAMQKIGLPYQWALAIGLALRYLGTLNNLYTQITEAQQARGLELSQQRFIARARAAVPTLVALIVSALRLSDSLALGLAARGFARTRHAHHKRTYLHDIHMQAHDWIVLVAATGLFAALLAGLLILA